MLFKIYIYLLCIISSLIGVHVISYSKYNKYVIIDRNHYKQITFFVIQKGFKWKILPKLNTFVKCKLLAENLYYCHRGSGENMNNSNLLCPTG